MNNSETFSIAQSFAVSPEVVPFLPELMADRDGIGVSPNIIVRLLQSLELTPEFTRVLDLGCGKGVVACAVAEALRFSVVSVDALPEFVVAARRLAAERQLSNLCSFRCEDIRCTVDSEVDYDVVMLLAVGPIWGDMEKTMAAIRRCARPGGYLIIADGFRATETSATWANYADHRHTLAQLMAHGDVLLEEVLLSPEQMTGLRPSDITQIAQRAEKLAQLHPESADLLIQFVDSIGRAAERWQTEMKAAIWVLMKGILIANR